MDNIYGMTFGSAMAMRLPVSGDMAMLADREEKARAVEAELDMEEAAAFEREVEAEYEAWELRQSIGRRYGSAIRELL